MSIPHGFALFSSAAAGPRRGHPAVDRPTAQITPPGRLPPGASAPPPALGTAGFGLLLGLAAAATTPGCGAGPAPGAEGSRRCALAATDCPDGRVCDADGRCAVLDRPAFTRPRFLEPRDWASVPPVRPARRGAPREPGLALGGPSGLETVLAFPALPGRLPPSRATLLLYPAHRAPAGAESLLTVVVSQARPFPAGAPELAPGEGVPSVASSKVRRALPRHHRGVLRIDVTPLVANGDVPVLVVQVDGLSEAPWRFHGPLATNADRRPRLAIEGP